MAFSTLLAFRKKGGKSGGKSDKKAAKDASIKSMSEANSKLWEARLEIAEQAKTKYRDSSHRLLLENESLQGQMRQTEKDTIDVINYLKHQDQEKDRQMDKVIQQMKELKKEHRQEGERLVDEFQQQIRDLDEKLSQKTHEVEVLQTELKLVKEFRKKRAHMQKELDEIKEAMLDANREHKSTLARMEHKFFEEKMRLQQEANKKIEELADRAHTEAISNLDETTRSVYKENVRLNQALVYHMQEGERLKNIKEGLDEENKTLRSEKEMNALVIQKKVSQSQQHKQIIKELQEKVETLERSLSHVVREFEMEMSAERERHAIATETARVELAKLQRVVALKTKEMNKVKKLAKNILDQRTEMERFFLDSLAQVKEEISTNRLQYRQDARMAYQHRMLDAYTGKADYPKVRTFTKVDHSTNSVFRDLEAAEQILYEESPRGSSDKLDISSSFSSAMNLAEKVDIADLTWEQKEKVLRYLFAKMNDGSRGHDVSYKSSKVSIATKASEALRPEDMELEPPADGTFLTQVQMSLKPKLPQIVTPAVEMGVGDSVT
ncbi:Basal body-orientation factor 1 [Lamellibrachia satsuma]|nr:Basal body-orientation factor 1 [Lamellibrachia satsuma]